MKILQGSGSIAFKIADDNGTNYSYTPKIAVGSVQQLYVPNAGVNHRYPYKDEFMVVIMTPDGKVLMQFDIQDCTGQSGWTATPAGLSQAVSDISSWL